MHRVDLCYDLPFAMDVMESASLPYINRKTLGNWAGPTELREGKRLFDNGFVKIEAIEPPMIRGVIDYGSRDVLTRFRVSQDGSIENLCPCRDCRERGLVCSHAIALGLAYVDLHSDSRTDRQLRIEARKEAEEVFGPGEAFIKRAPGPDGKSIKASIRLRLESGWQEARLNGGIPLQIQLCWEKKRTRIERVSTAIPFAFGEKDLNLLYILEDMAGGPIKEPIHIDADQMVDLLDELAGTSIHLPGGEKSAPIKNDPVVPHVSAAMDEQTGDLLLKMDLAGTDQRSEDPLCLVGKRSGWIYADGCFRPLADLLPDSFRDLYDGERRIERSQLVRFLRTELPRLEDAVLVDMAFPVGDLVYIQGSPEFMVRLSGNHEELTIDLDATYEGYRCPAGADTAPFDMFAAPDPENLLTYATRDHDAEKAALDWLGSIGLAAERGDHLPRLYGTRQVMEFLAAKVPVIRSRGWDVEFGGWLETLTRTAEWVVPSLEVKRLESGEGGFQVSFRYIDGNQEPLPPHLIEEAWLRGESCIQMHKRTLLVDRDVFQTFHDLLDDCGIPEAVAEETYRIDDVHAGYFLASVETARGLHIEGRDEINRDAELQNRNLAFERAELNSFLEETLRPYQKEGVDWLRYLERGGFAGILADEMGLGKTIQTLAWLLLPRLRKDLQKLPALVVCPTSLVVNWAEEAKRFTPDLKVHIVAGQDRHKSWHMLKESDLVITSYALLRRDIDVYRIKNHSTQNARCAKMLNASLRLVLTGTPIENSVSDLWSIMDFLMPGYLGNHARFRRHYEMPIAGKGGEAEHAHARLRRKIHPFLMRRLKKDVARELPDKIDRVAYCEMTDDQMDVYRQLLETTSRQISDMVEAQGFNRSKFTIFRTLTRLRQACCHLDLLKMPSLQYENPSGKMDLFMELLDEAMDGGHRVLVFSQFVSMLQILKKELVRRKIRFCYLDGSTVDRMSRVNEFNHDDTIPLFLISLKAGGTGLNLTGADMVIHYDPWWNPAVEDQATDRAHRIGQEKTVYNIKMITRGTIEEKVLSMQERKREVIDATLTMSDDLSRSLTWDDIKELLSV